MTERRGDSRVTYWPKWSTRAVESTWQSPDALDMVESLAREVPCPLCAAAPGEACCGIDTAHRRASHGTRVCRGLTRAKMAVTATGGAANLALSLFGLTPKK